MHNYSISHRINWLIALMLFVCNYIFHNGVVFITTTVCLLLATGIQNGWRLHFRKTPFLLISIGFLVFGLMSYLWSESPALVLYRCKQLLILYLGAYATLICFQDDTNIDGLLKLLMFGGYFTVLGIFMQLGVGGVSLLIESGERISNELLNANTLGMLCASSININVFYLLYKREVKWWSLLMIPAFIFLALSSSRKAFIMVGLGVFILLFFHNSKSKNGIRKLIKILAIPVTVVLFAFLISRLGIFSNVLSRFTTFINMFTGGGHVDRSSRDRSTLIRLGWTLFKSHPFGGVGMDNARLYTAPYIRKSAYLHSNYAEILADLGIIGFAIYYSYYLYYFVNSIRLREWSDDEYIVCNAILFVEALLEIANVTYLEYKMLIIFVIGFTEINILKRKRVKMHSK